MSEPTTAQADCLRVLRSLGTCQAAEVARALGVSRSSAYDRLMRLKVKGLVVRSNGRWTAA